MSQGPAWVTQKHGFDSVPVLARPGSVIPFGAVHDQPDYAWADGVQLRAFAVPDGRPTRVTVPAPDGGEPTEFEVVVHDGTPTTLLAGPCSGFTTT